MLEMMAEAIAIMMQNDDRKPFSERVWILDHFIPMMDVSIFERNGIVNCDIATGNVGICSQWKVEV